MYKIKTTALNKTLNIFEKLSALGITQDSLEKRISNKDVFVLPEDTPEVKREKELAFAIYNGNNKVIQINLDNDLTQIDNIINYEALVSAIFLKKEELYINVVGSDKQKKALGKLEPVLDNIDTTEKIQALEAFDFSLPTQDNSFELWSDKEYVLEKMKEDYSNIHLIDESLWKDIDFLSQLLPKFYNSDSFNKVKEEHLFTEEFITTLAKTNATLFEDMWSRYYEKLYKDDYFPSWQVKPISELDEEELMLYKRSMNVKKVLKEQVFNNLETMLILAENKSVFTAINQNLKSNLFKSEKMVSLLYQHLNKGDRYYDFDDIAIRLLPPSYFDSPEKTIEFLKNTKVEAYKLKPYMYECWINDKSACLKIASQFPGRQLFVELFKPHLKDTDFLDKYMQLNPQVWLVLPEKQKQDMKYLSFFIRNGQYSNYLNDEKYLKIIDTDENLVKTFIGRTPEVLRHYSMSETIKKWRQNENLVALMGKEFNYALDDLPKRMLTRLIAREDLVKKLLVNNPRLFNLLPISLQLDPTVAGIQLGQENYLNGHEALWLNQDFCLIALKKDIEYIKHIPTPVLRSKEFIYKVLKEVDDANIPKDRLKYLPDELNAILDNYGIKEGYVAFLQTFELNRKMQNNLSTQVRARKLKI